MKRYIILAVTAFVTASLPLGWMLISNRAEGGDKQAAYLLLRREAGLVAHFCLNRIPPMVGSATIPNEWEKALGSTIRLREGAGEVAHEATEFSAHAEEIQKLTTGKSIVVTAKNDEGTRHWIVYKPAMPGNQMLVMSKAGETAERQLYGERKLNPILLALIAGIIAAMIQLVIARKLFPPTQIRDS